MKDVCMVCFRPIFTVNAGNYHGVVTLEQWWTHGGMGIIDRMHMPTPNNHDYRVAY